MSEGGSGAQRVDDRVADRLVDRGVDRDLADRARWVVPPVSVDSFRYQLRFPGRDFESVTVRDREPGEMGPSECGGHADHTTLSQHRREQRDEPDPDIDREPVARALYDPDLDWSQYVSYRCRMGGCQEQCINRLDSHAATHRCCWECVGQHHLDPDLRTLALADLDLEDSEPNDQSDGEPSRVQGGASAPSAASGEAAGSDPLRVDPEAGAHAPERSEGGHPEAVRSALEQRKNAVSRLSLTKRADDKKRREKPSAR